MLQLKAFAPTDLSQEFSIEVYAQRHDSAIQASFRLKGPLEKLKMPHTTKPKGPEFNQELWKHSCFELFLKSPDSDFYWEWNFAPNLDWGHFSFESYRMPAINPSHSAGIQSFQAITEKSASLEILVQIRPEHSPWLMWALMNRLPLKIGFAAIVEFQDSTLSYWALKHPGPKPDFHLEESFAFNL